MHFPGQIDLFYVGGGKLIECDVISDLANMLGNFCLEAAYCLFMTVIVMFIIIL